MTDRLTEIRAAQIAQNETQPMWVRDLAADYCETLKKLVLQEGYTRGWEERARKAESERDDLLARLAACEEALRQIIHYGEREAVTFRVTGDIARAYLAANTSDFGSSNEAAKSEAANTETPG